MGGAAVVRVARRRLAAAAVCAAAALLGVLFAASGARAAELVYWDNLTTNTIGVVNLDGSGASLLNTSGAGLEAPEGMSYDPVSNRLYVASNGSAAGSGQIAYVNLDGSGGGTMPVPANGLVKDPRGVVVDPVARIAYWINEPLMEPETISWARLDGSEGGNFPLGGQPLVATVRLTADPTSGRLYWGNNDGSIHFAPLIGSTGSSGQLAVEGFGAGAAFNGLSIDPASGRIFWAEAELSDLRTAMLTGSAKETLNVGGAPVNEPQGVAFDPSLDRLYWMNWGNQLDATNAIGFFGFASGPGAITPGVEVGFPQDPIVIKSPTGLALPTTSEANGVLTCLPGTWGGDFVSSFVYRSPRSFSYQWTVNDTPIPGATASTMTPTVSGRYKCVVTATNQAGSTSRSSLGRVVSVTPAVRPGKRTTKPKQSPKPKAANLQLLGKARHLRARPGRLLTLKVRTTNLGPVASSPAKLCLKLTKGAKRALRAGKCQRLGPLAPGATAIAQLRLRVKLSAAPGRYRLRIAVPGDTIKVTVRVLR